MNTRHFFDRIKGGLIVSLYANDDYNSHFAAKEPMIALARSVVAGGSAAEIEAAHKLLTSGAITAEEFEKLKAKALA